MLTGRPQQLTSYACTVDITTRLQPKEDLDMDAQTKSGPVVYEELDPDDVGDKEEDGDIVDTTPAARQEPSQRAREGHPIVDESEEEDVYAERARDGQQTVQDGSEDTDAIVDEETSQQVRATVGAQGTRPPSAVTPGEASGETLELKEMTRDYRPEDAEYDTGT
eukprot:scaffold1085_cov407-Prasinococcus_capsulatus_cf.AAC.12